MGSPVFNDFNLDSEGHCFFCLKKIPVKVKHEKLVKNPQSQKFSVHYLARYLKMDMGKVFNDEGQIDSSLLAKVRKSRLKVELCEKCTSLNMMFSGLSRQLEKLEIEINSRLREIREELLGADRSDKLSIYRTKFSSDSSRSNEVSEIVDVLREEAIQKCSEKLRVIPRVKIEKVTKKQISAELSKHQTNSAVTPMAMEPETELLCEKSPKERNIKAEFESPMENPLLDDDTRNYGMDSEAMDEDQAITTEAPWGSCSGNEQNLGTDVETSTNSLVIISTATTSTNSIEKEKISINLGNGRWKCSACSLELTSDSGIRQHYLSVHKKIRFRCVPCGKEFSHKQQYNRHHQSVHVGVKFQCLGCNKLFSQKGNLRTHQRTSGCKKGTG